MARRLDGLYHRGWVDAMVTLLTHQHRKPFFRIDLGVVGIRNGQRFRMNVAGWHRWHESGDLQGQWHLAKICYVAFRTPHIRHWLATREIKMVTDYVKGGGFVPDNLTIRVSATMVDQGPPSAWPLTSTVHDATAPTGYPCKAPDQGNECRDCRACWSRDVPNIAYKRH
jgi:hypothetical protein